MNMYFYWQRGTWSGTNYGYYLVMGMKKVSCNKLPPLSVGKYTKNLDISAFVCTLTAEQAHGLKIHGSQQILLQSWWGVKHIPSREDVIVSGQEAQIVGELRGCEVKALVLGSSLALVIKTFLELSRTHPSSWLLNLTAKIESAKILWRI